MEKKENVNVLNLVWKLIVLILLIGIFLFEFNTFEFQKICIEKIDSLKRVRVDTVKTKGDVEYKTDTVYFYIDKFNSSQYHLYLIEYKRLTDEWIGTKGWASEYSDSKIGYDEYWQRRYFLDYMYDHYKLKPRRK